MKSGKWKKGIRTETLVCCLWLLAITGCEKKCEHKRIIQLVDVTRSPLKAVAVVPIRSVEVQQGWWQPSRTETHPDTLWSDAQGCIELPFSPGSPPWNGALIELHHHDTLPKTYCIPLEWACESQHRQIVLPASLSIKFVGNRMGHSAGAGCWILNMEEPLNVDSSHWFTPGQAPRPSLLKTAWIHPNDSFPAHRSFRMLLPSGTVKEVPDVVIQAEHIGDTLIHSIES